MKRTVSAVLVIAMAFLSGPATSAPVGTAFTYQGRLKDAGVPATGVYDFEFKLYDEATGGTQIGAALEKEDVGVQNGVFTVSLDFGGAPFKGAARFLEIGVRPGTSTDPYVALSGRHELAPSPYALSSGSSKTYRFATFQTYDNATGTWFDGNNAQLFGGINPSNWTDNGALASQLSSDKGVLAALFNTTRTISPNGDSLVHADNVLQYSSTTGRVVVALFRVRNTTAAPINWTPWFRYTSYGGWNEWASLTLNGANDWNSGGAACGAANCNAAPTLSIPANRTSTVVVVATTGPPLGVGGPVLRPVLLGFIGGSLNLPAGLEFVDDLDTAPNGWSN